MISKGSIQSIHIYPIYLIYPLAVLMSEVCFTLRSKPVFLPPTIFAVVPTHNLRSRLRIMFGRSMCFIECTNSIKQYQMEAYEAS